MKTSIGGDRIGSGNKQNVSLKNYSRSSHDLGYLWRSSMSSGTLVPFMSELGLPGDSFDIDLDCNVLTLPTIGPLFGSYKVQLDVFSVPIRLYNGKLHMNKLGIGMDMSEIKLPQLTTRVWQEGTDKVRVDDNEQINASCILSYLNMRGLGIPFNPQWIFRDFNALSFLSYWDIYKQYYANKQEETGVMISQNVAGAVPFEVFSAYVDEDGVVNPCLNTPVAVTRMEDITLTVTIYGGTGDPTWSDMIFKQDTFEYNLDQNFGKRVVNGLTATWSQYVSSGSADVSIPFQTIEGTNDPQFGNTPKLVRFPLENIDTMREDILKDVSSATAFKINETTYAPYGNVLNFNIEDKVSATQFNQEGLAIKTYQSDLFNNWITTEWIDGANGINEVTAVDTTGDQFTIDALNLANKVYNMLNRIAISGGSYDDWLDAVYTHERSKSAENPIYQGSLIKELSFQEVISTADTQQVTDNPDGQPLGTLAGRGKMTGKNKGGKIKVKVDEPSYIMGIVSITPRIDYSQGNKWDVNLKTMNDFHKPALDAIGYQDLITDQMAWFDTTYSAQVEDVPEFKSAGKQPAWINYMTNVNQVRGNFAEKNSQMFMVLNRRYENEGWGGITDLTTYVDPSKFNHIFADTRIDAQNFWVQIKCDILARRKISAKVIPNL